MNQEATVKNPLQSLVESLESQKKVKHDIVVPSGHIRYEGGLLHILSEGSYAPTAICHSQIATRLEIPTGYYDRMRLSTPELLENNINTWLSKKTNMNYLLRNFNYTDDNKICRAMLSNKYNILDNYDVLISALSAIKSMGVHVEIVKAEVTDRKMYLHIICPEIQQNAEDVIAGYLEHKEAKNVGFGIVSGLVISNSEIGMGSYEISSRAVVLRCNNGLVNKNATFRKVHLGAKMDQGFVKWSDDTIRKNYELVMSQTRDAVKLFLSQDHLGQTINVLREAKNMPINHPIGVIERVGTELNIPTEHKNNILNFFMRDGDINGSGVFNAFTREAQNMQADLQHEVESRIFEMMPHFKAFDKPFSIN